MRQPFIDEVFKEIDFEGGKVKLRYFISNYGRIMSKAIKYKEGYIRKEWLANGYPIFFAKVSGKKKAVYIHKLMGQYFIEKESEDQEYVIHIDHNVRNNHISNLKWVLKKEMTKHAVNSPASIAKRQREKENPRFQGHKLNSTQVMLIKKKIFDPNRKTRMKMIAKQFGISEMQLYRIKTGENWGHVKVNHDYKKKDPKI